MEAKSIGESLSAISVIITAVYDVIREFKGFFRKNRLWWRNRRLKRQYKKGEKEVDKGDVDDINDIITG